MGKHVQSGKSRRLSLAAIAGAGLIVTLVAAGPASAASNNCGTTPGHSEVVHHAAVTHQVTHATPGTPASTDTFHRWSKDVPEIPAVMQQQAEFSRVVPAQPGATHLLHQYREVVPGTPAVNDLEVWVSRTVEATPPVTHEVYRFWRSETVTTPPEGNPTIPNPDYKPAWDETVVITEAYTDYVKWDWTGGPVDSTPTPPPGDGWHEVGVTNDSKGGSPDVVHAGNGKASYFYYKSVHHDAVTQVIHHPAVGTPTIPNPGYKPGSTEMVTVYRMANGGTTTDLSQAGEFTQSSFPEWMQLDSTTKQDSPGTAAYKVYLAADGTFTTDKSQAGLFPIDSLPALQALGWSQYGEPQVVPKLPATPDVTYYLVVASDGTLSISTNPADASWVDPTVTTVDPKWSSFADKTVQDEGRDSYMVFLAQDGTTTTDPAEAGSFPLSERPDLIDQGWSQLGETKLVEITPAQPGYTKYYKSVGDPSITLTDDNWTKDSPEGWHLVDTKSVVTPAVPGVTTHTTATDKAAWDETIVTPAKDKICPAVTVVSDNGGSGDSPASLAMTGADSTGLFMAGGTLMLGGLAALTLASRSRRRKDGVEA